MYRNTWWFVSSAAAVRALLICFGSCLLAEETPNQRLRKRPAHFRTYISLGSNECSSNFLSVKTCKAHLRGLLTDLVHRTEQRWGCCLRDKIFFVSLWKEDFLAILIVAVVQACRQLAPVRLHQTFFSFFKNCTFEDLHLRKKNKRYFTVSLWSHSYP